MYDVYLGKTLCPIAPEKLKIKIGNKNKTMTLINEGEINLLKTAGLSEITFELLLPNVKYPFAVYKTGFKTADYYLDALEKLKAGKKPFKFKVVRRFPDGGALFGTNMTVALEDYEINENKKEGFDVVVSVKLKQYNAYGTKLCKVTGGDGKTQISRSKPLRPSTVREQVPLGIGSDVIINGRLHGSSYGDAPGQMRTNYRGKINFINLKGSHPYHVTTPDGAWLGWVTKDSVKAVQNGG